VATAGLARGRGETVLVVDDELTVREITRVVLTELNYRVILAVDGTDALMKLVDNPSEINVVITDLQMPHMDGRVLIEALRRMSPDARIILASGTVDMLDDASFRTLGVHAILRKPFSRADLVAALAATLSTNPVLS
jgi:CheY-like chemotaxis protein